MGAGAAAPICPFSHFKALLLCGRSRSRRCQPVGARRRRAGASTISLINPQMPGDADGERVEPAAQQLEQLAQIPEDQPVAMINLLQFNQPDGVEHYERYAREVLPHLERVGATRSTPALRRHW